MRTALFLSRSCLRQSAPRLRHGVSRCQQRFLHVAHPRPAHQSRIRLWSPPAGAILLGALSPAAFVLLSEEDNGDGGTSEERMLQASRDEMAKIVPANLHGVRRLGSAIYLMIDNYLVEPLATGFRFLHLVIIFVPVIFSVPAIWFGARVADRDNEHAGTLWWYGFLVSSMERAGPAFIKVQNITTWHVHGLIGSI